MINFNPIHEIFSLGPFHVYSWGFMFVIGFLVASFFILKEAAKKKIDKNFILNVMLFTLLGAIIGGRLFFVFENFNYFLHHLGEILAFGKGGETSYGGIILGLLFSWLYVKFSRNKNKLSFSELLDLVAPYAVLGLAIGRIGCFLNWDDFGIVSSLPWAINAAGEGIARHPTMLYETVYCLIIFGVLMWFKKIKENPNAEQTGFKLLLEKKGSLFLFFLIFYSVFRFFNDFLRIYSNHFLGLALSQWILIFTFVISILILWKKK